MGTMSERMKGVAAQGDAMDVTQWVRQGFEAELDQTAPTSPGTPMDRAWFLGQWLKMHHGAMPEAVQQISLKNARFYVFDPKAEDLPVISVQIVKGEDGYAVVPVMSTEVLAMWRTVAESVKALKSSAGKVPPHRHKSSHTHGTSQPFKPKPLSSDPVILAREGGRRRGNRNRGRRLMPKRFVDGKFVDDDGGGGDGDGRSNPQPAEAAATEEYQQSDVGDSEEREVIEGHPRRARDPAVEVGVQRARPDRPTSQDTATAATMQAATTDAAGEGAAAAQPGDEGAGRVTQPGGRTPTSAPSGTVSQDYNPTGDDSPNPGGNVTGNGDGGPAPYTSGGDAGGGDGGA